MPHLPRVFSRRLITSLLLLLVAAATASGCTAEEAKQTAKVAAEKGAQLAKEGAELAKEGYEAAKPALEQGVELAKEGAVKGAELAKEGYDAAKPALDKAGAVVVENVDAAIDKTAQLAKEGYDAAKPTLDKGYDAARDGLTTAADQTKALGGQVTDASWAWVQAQAAKSESVTAMIDRTKQVSNAAADIYAVLDAVIDSDSDIEVIYQPISDTAKADQAIQGMPRVEVIDGLQVGFQDMTGYQNAERVNESAYMVVWRQGDTLMGFIYRSRSGVKLDVLVKEAPRLIAAARSVGRAVVPSLKSAPGAVGAGADADATDAPPAADATP